MRRNAKVFRQWASLRNDLVHEGSWGRVLPGHRPPMRARRQYLPLRAFATLSLLAAVGVRGQYLRSQWRAVSKSALLVS